jgi:hypothetical protein
VGSPRHHSRVIALVPPFRFDYLDAERLLPTLFHPAPKTGILSGREPSCSLLGRREAALLTMPSEAVRSTRRC